VLSEYRTSSVHPLESKNALQSVFSGGIDRVVPPGQIVRGVRKDVATPKSMSNQSHYLDACKSIIAPLG
jgi:hypothetical protein